MKLKLTQVNLKRMNEITKTISSHNHNPIKKKGTPQYFCILPSGNIELYPRPDRELEMEIYIDDSGR